MNCIVTGNETEITKILKKAGCCLRCCLRFIGSRNTNYYKDPLSTLQTVTHT